MGSSGTGKSTLLNILGCLDTATSGTYEFDGTNVTAMDDAGLSRLRNEKIGFVFQQFHLLPRLTALANVQLPLIYTQKYPKDARERAENLLKLVGLSDRMNYLPGQMSGGQQQRVAIARALVCQPRMILADEPTGNLDSATANEIMNTLRTLNREKGLTIVLVTHESDMAEFADRIVTMRDGRVLSDRHTRPRDPMATASPTGPPSVHGRGLPDIPQAESPAKDGVAVWASLLRMAFLVASRAIARNKLRSALTMLGIFIGVAALITMVAVGQGANQAVIAQIEALGSNLLVVSPGPSTTGGVNAGFGSASTLRVADAEAIREEASAVANVSYLLRGPAQAQYGGRNWNTLVQGISAGYLEIQSWPLAAGRRFNLEDHRDAARVCVLGQTAFRNLFGPHEDPIGATILLRGVPLEVVGLLAPLGQSGGGRDQDDVIQIPFSTAETKVLGVAAPTQLNVGQAALYPTAPNPFGIQPKLTGLVNQIFVQARGPDLVDTALAEVTELLDRRHRIAPGAVRDFDLRNLSQVAQAREGSSRVMALLLSAVASISLIVGGIGIMNILLVSVTERTREIGIRMAIGARRTHVLLQFLVEAVLLSGIGGVAGIAVGVLLTQLISWLAGWPTLLSPVAIGGGFLFSAAVGIFFGYYPARRASMLNPIEALRYE